MRYRYDFRSGFRLCGDPQVVGECLEEIRQKNGGWLQAEAVVREARNPKNPLHRYFEWDDRKAAHQYRLRQADYLIRAVVVCPEEGEHKFEPVRAFVCLERESDSKAYSHVCAAMRDETTRQQILERAYRELQWWRRKYAALVEFADLFAVIDRFAFAEAGH